MSLNETTIEAVKEKLNERVPGKPLPKEDTIYRLRFKKGRSPVQELFFKFPRNQVEAEKIAKIYCAEWKYRCIWVEEFLTDILSKPVEFDDSGDPIRPRIVQEIESN